MDELIIKIITTIAGGVGIVISTITAVVQKIKKDNVRKSDSIYERMLSNIQTAEEMYRPIEKKGIDCSAMKKQFVLSDLQIFANSKGLRYDQGLWEAELEHLIDFSKNVNNKDNAHKEVII